MSQESQNNHDVIVEMTKVAAVADSVSEIEYEDTQVAFTFVREEAESGLICLEKEEEVDEEEKGEAEAVANEVLDEIVRDAVDGQHDEKAQSDLEED